jgi:hypothetical protein
VPQHVDVNLERETSALVALAAGASNMLPSAHCFDWVWLMLGLWLALTASVMITSHITRARGDKPSRALWEAIVANLIFGALLVWRSL